MKPEDIPARIAARRARCRALIEDLRPNVDMIRVIAPVTETRKEEDWRPTKPPPLVLEIPVVTEGRVMRFHPWKPTPMKVKRRSRRPEKKRKGEQQGAWDTI